MPFRLAGSLWEIGFEAAEQREGLTSMEASLLHERQTEPKDRFSAPGHASLATTDTHAHTHAVGRLWVVLFSVDCPGNKKQ
jgi:hypothetical protein